MHELRCVTCGHLVDASGVFPGGSVGCLCGASLAVPASTQGRPAPVTAYRSPDSRRTEIGSFACPFCGGACPADVRDCPHCAVRLLSLRCGHCFALEPPGNPSCGKCGHERDLEPLLGPTPLGCPRCGVSLETADEGQGVLECGKCGGMFVGHGALARIMAERRTERVDAPRAPFHPPLEGRVDEVRYLECPECRSMMNRRNFGSRSGIVVDVCKAHGTWFDTGELTRAVAFASTGGLARAEKVESQRNAEAAAREHAEARRLHAELVVLSSQDSRRSERNLVLFTDMLRFFLG